MNGRLEQENKIFLSIEKKLQTMPTFITSWYISLKASDNSANTCRDYINKVGQYLFYISSNVKSIQLSDLTFDNVSKYYISIKTKTDDRGILTVTSDSYQQTVWCCLNNLFNFLYTQHYIPTNFMNAIKKPKNKDLPRINEHRVLLTKQDFNEILQSVKTGCGSHKAQCFQENMRDRDMTIMLIFMCTGIRKSALTEINIENIDFKNQTLFILDKGDIYHKYKLNNMVMSSLSNWISKRSLLKPSNNALFISYQGSRMSGGAISKLVGKYCEEALGYKISPHKLRSGFCSIMYQETGDIEKVRRMVGHANISTTQRYIVTNNSESEEAAKITENIFKKNET